MPDTMAVVYTHLYFSVFEHISEHKTCSSRVHTRTVRIHTELSRSPISSAAPSQIQKRKMKHLCVFVLQVIHLWFEEFALEDTQLCTADFITLQDSVGIIGKYHT